MLCIIPQQFIYFITGSLYLLIPFTHSAHSPTPLPLVTTVCSLYLWVLCFVCSFVLFFRFHIKVKQYLLFPIWLISLGIIHSRSIHVVPNGKVSSFLWVSKTLESPLDCKEIQPVHSEGDQSWDFFGRNDAKAETPVLWPPHGKSWLIGKDSDAGRDWGQEEEGTTEDEMAVWHHWLNGRESQWTPGVGDGQGGLVCCDSWGHKESDMTERLNWTDVFVLELGRHLHQGQKR